MSLESLRAYVKEIEKDERNSHGYRAHASFLMLEHVDLMVERYLNEKQTQRGAILLDVFGILQGLFVAIDALYDLSIGLTRYKYPININQNKILHELKYIRNDIVGHPTHRTYPNGGMGFSILDTSHLSKEKMTYKTYIYEKNSLRIETKDVLFESLITQYKKEKLVVLKDIERTIRHDQATTDIPEQLAIFHETLNKESLLQIIETFKKTYDVDESSSHRFLWRANLLIDLLSWQENDDELKEILLYMMRFQTSKLYDMALDMEDRRQKALYTPIPKLLHGFYKFVRKHEKIVYPLMKNLNDAGHPLHDSDLMGILSLNPNEDAYKLLNFFKAQTNPDRKFLIGSILRAYRPKS
jgi:hypothetical protein